MFDRSITLGSLQLGLAQKQLPTVSLNCRFFPEPLLQGIYYPLYFHVALLEIQIQRPRQTGSAQSPVRGSGHSP